MIFVWENIRIDQVGENNVDHNTYDEQRKL